jgi:hypothetical protein
MARRLLRVFPAVEPESPPQPEAGVRIRLGDLLPLVAMAQRMHFVWLQDFLDDEVRVTNDLYEVLQAFRTCRPSA